MKNKNIRKAGKSFQVRFQISGVLVDFGCFDTLNEAQELRDEVSGLLDMAKADPSKLKEHLTRVINEKSRWSSLNNTRTY